MRRLVLVLLMMVLSLQSVWSVAAATCAHEETMASTHFGHHERHHAQSALDGASDDGRSNLAETDHHHILGVSPLPHVPVLPAFVDEGAGVLSSGNDRYPTTSPATPERPPRTLAEASSARPDRM